MFFQVIVHPHFRNLSHDLALLKLDRNIEFDGANISPICLPFTGIFPDLDKVSVSLHNFLVIDKVSASFQNFSRP